MPKRSNQFFDPFEQIWSSPTGASIALGRKINGSFFRTFCVKEMMLTWGFWLVIVYFFYPSNFVICLPVNFPPHVGHLVLPFHRKICTIYFYIVPNNHVSYFSWYILKMVDFMFREKNNKDVDGLIHSQNQTSRLYPD